MKFQRKELEPVGFQVTPLIDVVLFLLSFFVVTWKLTNSETELDVAVPTSAEGSEPQHVQTERIINVLANGKVIVDRRELNTDELYDMMKKLAELYKNQPIRLRADKETKYEHVINVVSTCTKAGIWNISFATARPQPEGP